jgi:methylisocitrate lyase
MADAAAKRRALRERLRSPEVLVLPGAFNPLSARLIERHGFEAVYLSGAVIAADLGLPDIGLTTLTEVAQRAHQVARSTNLPLLVDADTGFGEPVNAARTVTVLEEAGAAGLHLEDQVNPKRCGHLDGKAVIERDEAMRRITAATRARRDPNFLLVARTDARAVEGFDAALERARAYADAGADAIFAEALLDESEFERFCAGAGVPVLANMTEFGKGPRLSARRLGELGVAMVIFPVSLLRLAMGAAERGLRSLARDGQTDAVTDQMQTRDELYDLVDYASYVAFDQAVYDFRPTGSQ